MANDLGISSPTTTCRVVIRKYPIATAITEMTASGKPSRTNSGRMSAEIAGSPNQPSASEASVMPSWQADRYALTFSVMVFAFFAPRFPSS